MSLGFRVPSCSHASACAQACTHLCMCVVCSSVRTVCPPVEHTPQAASELCSGCLVKLQLCVLPFLLKNIYVPAPDSYRALAIRPKPLKNLLPSRAVCEFTFLPPFPCRRKWYFAGSLKIAFALEPFTSSFSNLSSLPHGMPVFAPPGSSK